MVPAARILTFFVLAVVSGGALLPGCQGGRIALNDAGSPELPDFSRPASHTTLSKTSFRAQSPDDEFSTKVETPLIGEYTTIAGLNLVKLQGVGLIVGLEGTGSDPPVSIYRSKMLEEMRRRDVPRPNEMLRDPNTALVIVRAYLPPLVRKGDKFDVDVRLIQGDDAKSLRGGWLMACDLSEQAVIPGRGVLKGHVYARATGPVLISAGGADDGSRAGVMRRGRVLGGGVSLKDRDMMLYLRNDVRSSRNSARLANRIGERFYGYNRYGSREPLAEAKTDQKIELKILPSYRENFPRYLNVVRNIAFRESDVQRRVRMQKLQNELNEPRTSERAALQLEAIGIDAIPILKSALKNSMLEIRFHAAIALAYVGDASGLDVLTESARDEPAFRVFALAAMSTLDEADTHMALRELMNEDSAETRYGAFRALTTLDARDPFVRGEAINEEFMLHELDVDGQPMVHLTHWKKAEIVLFGRNLPLETPVALRAGGKILITGKAGADVVTVSRFQVGRPEQRKLVPANLADVIRTTAELGANYPDIAEMLVQAEELGNLPGNLEIDALPEAGRVYYRSKSNRSGGSRTRIGSSKMAPNLYSGLTGDESEDDEDAPPARRRIDDDSNEMEQDSTGEEDDGERDERLFRFPRIKLPELPFGKKLSDNTEPELEP